MTALNKDTLDQLVGMATQPVTVTAPGQVAIVPEGFRVTDLEKFAPVPARTRATPTMNTAESLVAYINRFAQGAAVIYADLESRILTAVLDHFEAGATSWGEHTATYRCPLSKEWQAWTSKDRSPMNQVEFAEFLEEHYKDIAPTSADYPGPTGGELLNLATNFQVTREAKFQSVKRLHDGTFQFAYSEENTGTGNTTLPETIRLGIAPFHGGEHYAIDVRIRYRLREGQLKLWFEMIEPERVLEDAFKGVLAKVQEELPESQVFEGKR